MDKFTCSGILVQRKHQRSSLFNLNDDEDVLTHYGQAVGQMDKFDDVVLTDEEAMEEGETRPVFPTC